jgi:hypothetical protein
LGKAEFRNGAPNYRVDTYAANIAQALNQKWVADFTLRIPTIARMYSDLMPRGVPT